MCLVVCVCWRASFVSSGLSVLLADEQTNKQANKLTADRQKDRQTNKLKSDKQTKRKTNKEIKRRHWQRTRIKTHPSKQN